MYILDKEGKYLVNDINFMSCAAEYRHLDASGEYRKNTMVLKILSK